MLNADFLVLSSGNIKGFEISGHAEYGSYGTDIVCSAVSSVCYMVVNTITDILKLNIKLDIDEKCGYMHVIVPKKNISDCQTLFQGLKIHLLMIEKMYPKNLKVSYKEVD